MVSRVWNIGTFQSKNFKMVHVNNQMTTSDFILKVAKIFNVRKELICVTFEFPLNDGSEVVKMEIEERDSSSLHHGIDVLKNYSKLTVEVKLEPSASELKIAEGKQVVRTKEVLAEQLKREMGLHNDRGKRSRGFMDAKWNAQCDLLMSEDSRFLLEFDKLKAGVKLVFGSEGYLLNPFQIICPLCMEIRVLSSMNQLRALLQHLKETHLEECKGNDARKCLAAWLENNFVSQAELDKVAGLPEGLISPDEMVATPRVRAIS